MKRNRLLLVLLLSLFACSVLAQYSVKSGYIEYELTGDVSGKRSIWFDNHGKLYCEIDSSQTQWRDAGEIFTTVYNRMIVYDSMYMYEVDLTERTGYRIEMPEWSEDDYPYMKMNDDEMLEYLRSLTEEMDGVFHGEEVFLGRKCGVFEMWGTKMWIYKGLALKTETYLDDGFSTVVATRFEENIIVPAEKFTVPGDIEISDYSNYNYEDDGIDYEAYAYVDIEMPYEEFEKAMNKVKIKGFPDGVVSDLWGSFVADWQKSMIETISISAKHIDNYYLEVDLVSESSEHFNKYGHDMIYTPLHIYAEGYASVLTIMYPEKNCYVTVWALPAISKKESLTIAKQIKF